MGCKDPLGGTHHFACDCREAMFRETEAELTAARRVVEAVRTALSNNFACEARDYDSLHAALAAYDEAASRGTREGDGSL